MIVVDSSALCAVLFNEPEKAPFRLSLTAMNAALF
ncbi:MAG: hypothetical protein QOH32_2800 [Bradyrhizobium sp.]|jgi:predicted nucleic acid-binding protein|nr:hypothetical protein [Bradyrhizobium sp.]